MSAASLPDFRVLDTTGDNPEGELLSSHSPRRRNVRDIIDRALLILESTRGRVALRDVGMSIVTGLRADGEQCLYPTTDIPDFDNMDSWIDFFLRKMRREFPEVFLMDTYEEVEASAERHEWAVRGTRLDDYVARSAGLLVLNAKIIRLMTSTRSVADSDMYMFQMSIAVAHEIVHLFTGFFTGTARTLTPDTLRIPGYLAPEGGEAGFFWEIQALGGIIEFYADPERAGDPVKQPGIPFIFPDARMSSRGRKVSNRYIQSFVAGGGAFSVPVRASDRVQPTTRTTLQRRTSLMIRVRADAAAREAAAREDLALGRGRRGQSSRHRLVVREDYDSGYY